MEALVGTTMKTKFTISLLALSIPLIAGASHISLGDREYPVLFEDTGEPAEFRNLVAEDIERIFAPLLTISNIVDVALLAPTNQCCIPLLYKDVPTYPEDFQTRIAMVCDQGTNSFVVSTSLTSLYHAKFDEIAGATNLLHSLDAVIADIRSGAVTNWPASDKVELLFIPPGSSFTNTLENADNLVHSLVLTNPFPPSRLDVSKIDVVGDERWIVPTKSTVIEPQGVSASFFLWIFDEGQWKVFFPSSLEGLDP